MKKSITRTITAAALALSLSASATIGLCDSPVIFNSFVAEAAGAEQIDPEIMNVLVSSGELGSTYTATINPYANIYTAVKYNITKAGTYIAHFKLTSNDVTGYMLDAQGNVLGSHDFTGATNEEWNFSKNFSSATSIYLMICNKSLKSTLKANVSLESTTTKNIADASISATWPTPQKPNYTLKFSGVTLKKGVDYTVESEQASAKVEQGHTNYYYVVQIKGIGDFTGSLKITLSNPANEEVQLKDLTQCNFSYSYKNDVPIYTVTDGNTTLKKGVDYSESCTTSDVTNNGRVYRTFKTTFIGIGDYEGQYTATIQNHLMPVADGKISIAECTIIPMYTGSKLNSLTVTYNGKALTKNTDYTYSSTITDTKTEGNTTTYTIKLVVTGKGNYTGSTTRTVTTSTYNQIPLNLDGMKIPDQQYTGKQIRPALTVSGAEGTLKLNTDYTVSYGTNKNIGSANNWIEIKGINKYTGTYRLPFKIVAAKIDSITGSISDQVYTGKAIKPLESVTTASGTTLYIDRDFTVTYKNNVNAGTATAVINFTGNYSGSITKTFKITQAKIKGANVIPMANATYTGKALKTVSKISLRTGETLTNGTDYTVAYSNNVNLGYMTAKITFKRNYTGSITAYIPICPVKTNITAQTSTKKSGAIALKVTNSNYKLIDGYKIEYSTSQDFKNSSYVVTGKPSKSTANYTLPGLTKGKTYYVRVSAFKRAVSPTKKVTMRLQGQYSSVYQVVASK